MFYHIAGKFVHKEENFAVIDCGGVGYRLTVSMNTADALGYADGERTVKLYTYLQVREDDVELFGFYTEDELAAFRLLISVSGVGPKAAMSILSLLTPEKLALAGAAEDIKAISRANGVGAKTAARVLGERMHQAQYSQIDARKDVRQPRGRCGHAHVFPSLVRDFMRIFYHKRGEDTIGN